MVLKFMLFSYFKSLHKKFNLNEIEKNDGEYAMFVGKNYRYYQARWLKLLNEDGSWKKFILPRYNWAAGLFTVFWFVYRKMYFYAFLILAVSITLYSIDPQLQISLLAFGFSANQMYLYHARKKLDKARGYPEEMKSIGGVNSKAPFIVFFILSLGATGFYMLENEPTIRKMEAKNNNPDVHDFEEKPCKELTSKDIEMIKAAFGDYYPILTKKMAGDKRYYTNGKTCVIQGAAYNEQWKEALILLEKNQVSGIVSIDGFLYKTANFDPKSKAANFGMRGLKGKYDFFTIGKIEPRYGLPTNNHSRVIEYNNEAVIGSERDDAWHSIRSFYKVGINDIYLIHKTQYDGKCEDGFFFLYINERKQTRIFPNFAICSMNSEFKEKREHDKTTVTFRKTPDTKIVATMTDEYFDLNEEKVTADESESAAWGR